EPGREDRIGLPDFGNIDLPAPKVPAAQLHVDLDAVDSPISDGDLSGLPMALPLPELPADALEELPTEARPRSRASQHAASTSAVRATDEIEPEPGAARRGRKKIVVALLVAGAVILAGGTAGVFLLGGASTGKIDAAAL